MTASSVRQIAADYITAVGQRDFDRLTQLLHPDLDFGGAAAPLHGGPAFVTAMRRLTTILDRNEIASILVDGNQAFVLYDFVTNTPAGRVLSGELLTIEDGQIRTIVLLWDQRRWPEVLQALQQQTQPAPAE